MTKGAPLLILFLILISCSQPQQSEELPAVLSAGTELMNEFQFEAADSAFAAAAQNREDSTWADYGRGMAAERQLEFYDALNTYWGILNRDADFAPAYGGVARSLTAVGKHLLAVDAAQEYAERGRGGNVDLELALAHLGAGQFESAREAIRKARGGGIDLRRAELIEARAAFLNGDFDDAKELLSSALGSEIVDPELLIEAANSLEAFGLADSAMTLSRKACELTGNDSRTIIPHLQRAYRTGYLAEARQYLAALKEKDPTGKMHALMEMLYYKTTEEMLQADLALMHYRRLCQPTFSQIVYELQIRQMSVDKMHANMILEELDASMGQLDPTPQLMTVIYEELMWGYLDIGMQAKAGGYTEEKLGIGPGDSRYQLIWATLMAEFGVLDKYYESVEFLTDRYGDQPDWLTRIADISIRKAAANEEDAERLYRLALEIKPGYVPAYEGLIGLLERKQRYADAYTAGEEFAELAERSPQLQVLRALSMVRTGRVEAGTELFLDNILYLKGSLNSYDDMLRVLERKNALATMKRVVDELIAHGDGAHAVLLLAAEWRSDLEDYAVALELAETVQQSDPENISARVQKARAWHGLGRTEEALTLFDSLYSVAADNSELALYYSRTLADEKRDFSKAENLARGALVTGRNLLKAWFNLCYVYMQEGRYNHAAGKARQASQVFPTDPVGFYYLGKAEFLGNDERAKQHLEKAVELGIYGDYLTETEEMLAKLR